jgi:hypothetical protein
MEVEILRTKSSNESVRDITRTSGIWIIRKVAWKGLTVLHFRHSSSFQGLLSEQS